MWRLSVVLYLYVFFFEGFVFLVIDGCRQVYFVNIREFDATAIQVRDLAAIKPGSIHYFLHEE